MSVNKDIFNRRRDFNYDFQEIGPIRPDWTESTRFPDELVPTHCSFCGVQCAMYLRVRDGAVTGVEPRDFAHNRGSLCPKGVVAYQQVGHPERLRYPMIRRGGKGGTLERASWDEALDIALVVSSLLQLAAIVIIATQIWGRILPRKKRASAER